MDSEPWGPELPPLLYDLDPNQHQTPKAQTNTRLHKPQIQPKPNPKVTDWCQDILRPRPQDQDSNSDWYYLQCLQILSHTKRLSFGGHILNSIKEI